MAEILYFHGFASSPGSAKLIALREVLEPEGIVFRAPDLNVPSFRHLRYGSMLELGIMAGRDRPPDLLVGSSLGSLLALDVARHGVDAPMVLIAPAIGVADRWKELLPDGDPIEVFNHRTGVNEPIHRAFFDEIMLVRPESRTPSTAVTAIMGTDDQSVPFDLVSRVWKRWQSSGDLPEISRFIAIEKGDHSLTGHIELIAREIRDRLSTRTPPTLS